MDDAAFNQEVLPSLARATDTRILFVVLDGLGGVIGSQPTALDRAEHPNLDALARESATGRHIPVAHGVTPGSGPGHFAIFGYDPIRPRIGRGLLEALGVGVDVQPGDVAIRGNFCSLDADGNLLDRRAGRIPTDQARPLAERLKAGLADVQGVAVDLHPGLQHRFALVLRGEGLDARVADTDPQRTGVEPLLARALDPAASHTAVIVNEIVRRARELLAEEAQANGILLRGFSSRPALKTLREIAALRPVAVAAYPAYRGVARMLGMDIDESIGPASSLADQVEALERRWAEGKHDFFFLHVKGTDSAGEDGDEGRKAAVIEEFDGLLPRLRALSPDVIVLTGDHSTPGPLANHSWHPVPTLVHGPWCEPDGFDRFVEGNCARGRLGDHLPAPAILRLALANAGKLAKFGA